MNYRRMQEAMDKETGMVIKPELSSQVAHENCLVPTDDPRKFKLRPKAELIPDEDMPHSICISCGAHLMHGRDDGHDDVCMGPDRRATVIITDNPTTWERDCPLCHFHLSKP